MQMLNDMTQEDADIMMRAYRLVNGHFRNFALDMLCDERNMTMHRDYEVMRMSMPDQSPPWHKRVNALPYG